MEVGGGRPRRNALKQHGHGREKHGIEHIISNWASPALVTAPMTCFAMMYDKGNIPAHAIISPYR